VTVLPGKPLRKGDAALRRRYRAAIQLLPDALTVDERIDLLIAIVWPLHERLKDAA
jgi:hypothetical protein